MQITLYSTTSCPYCKMAKDYFNSKQIKYVEKMIDQDEEVRKQMQSKSGGYLGVPFIVIEKNGIEVPVIGFDQSLIEKTIFGEEGK